jgi:hypothetical protein
VRPFAHGKALGACAGPSPTLYISGGTDREQGIGRAGNARLRTVLVGLAWDCQRYQPHSAVAGWFHNRLGGASPLVRQSVARGMPQHVGMDMEPKPDCLGRPLDDPSDHVERQRSAALRRTRTATYRRPSASAVQTPRPDPGHTAVDRPVESTDVEGLRSRPRRQVKVGPLGMSRYSCREVLAGEAV